MEHVDRVDTEISLHSLPILTNLIGKSKDCPEKESIKIRQKPQIPTAPCQKPSIIIQQSSQVSEALTRLDQTFQIKVSHLDLLANTDEKIYCLEAKIAKLE